MIRSNKGNSMHRQALEIPWKVSLVSDEQIAKMLKCIWEVPEPTPGPPQEIASSSSKTVVLPLALSPCGLMSLSLLAGS